MQEQTLIYIIVFGISFGAALGASVVLRMYARKQMKILGRYELYYLRFPARRVRVPGMIARWLQKIGCKCIVNYLPQRGRAAQAS